LTDTYYLFPQEERAISPFTRSIHSQLLYVFLALILNIDVPLRISMVCNTSSLTSGQVFLASSTLDIQHMGIFLCLNVWVLYPETWDHLV